MDASRSFVKYIRTINFGNSSRFEYMFCSLCEICGCASPKVNKIEAVNTNNQLSFQWIIINKFRLCTFNFTYHPNIIIFFFHLTYKRSISYIIILPFSYHKVNRKSCVLLISSFEKCVFWVVVLLCAHRTGILIFNIFSECQRINIFCFLFLYYKLHSVM